MIIHPDVPYKIQNDFDTKFQSICGCRAAALQIVVSRLWRDFEIQNLNFEKPKIADSSHPTFAHGATAVHTFT